MQQKLPGIAFFRAAFCAPVITNAVAVGLIRNWLLDGRGLINTMAKNRSVVHGAIPVLENRWLIVFSAISPTVWRASAR